MIREEVMPFSPARVIKIHLLANVHQSRSAGAMHNNQGDV